MIPRTRFRGAVVVRLPEGSSVQLPGWLFDLVARTLTIAAQQEVTSLLAIITTECDEPKEWMLEREDPEADRKRLAVAYVRESPTYHVRQDRKGKRRQYRPAERARGWGHAKVEIIDSDLGRSGSGSVVRSGIGQLLDWVCIGEAGEVPVLEASRLAQNNRHWQQLIDLGVMTSTLVINHDAVHEPRQVNDRLPVRPRGTLTCQNVAVKIGSCNDDCRVRSRARKLQGDHKLVASPGSGTLDCQGLFELGKPLQLLYQPLDRGWWAGGVSPPPHCRLG